MSTQLDLPIISVILTVYNGEKYLQEAINSLLEQSFTNFELIIINDGSIDGTSAILSSQTDERIVCLSNPENKGQTSGLAYSPNKAISIAQGEFIARQDADDISMPERFQEQVHFLYNHPEIGLVGTWVELITTRDRTIGISKPYTEPFQLKWELMFRNCFTQSSVMFRRSVIEDLGPYNLEMKHAEDYDLWWRISTKYGVAMIPKILVSRRMVEGGVVATFPELQREYSIEVIRRAFEQFLDESITTEQAAAVDGLMRNLPISDSIAPVTLETLILRMQDRYKKTENLDPRQQRWIQKNTAEKLYILAGKALSTHPLQALRIASKAEHLEFRIPYLKKIFGSSLFRRENPD